MAKGKEARLSVSFLEAKGKWNPRWFPFSEVRVLFSFVFLILFLAVQADLPSLRSDFESRGSDLTCWSLRSVRLCLRCWNIPDCEKMRKKAVVSSVLCTKVAQFSLAALQSSASWVWLYVHIQLKASGESENEKNTRSFRRSSRDSIVRKSKREKKH